MKNNCLSYNRNRYIVFTFTLIVKTIIFNKQSLKLNNVHTIAGQVRQKTKSKKIFDVNYTQ